MGKDIEGGKLMGLENKTMNKEEIEKLTGKYQKISDISAATADIINGIPFVGGVASTVATSISHLSKSAANTIQRKNPNVDNWYFVLPTSDFFDQILRIIEKIIIDSTLQEKYTYTKDCYEIKIWDDFLYRFENNEPTEETDISYYISIEFNDDKYSYKDIKNKACSISIQFNEKFKQINFETNKLYSAFEIISHGGSPSEKRKYGELSQEIVISLCNNLY